MTFSHPLYTQDYVDVDIYDSTGSLLSSPPSIGVTGSWYVDHTASFGGGSYTVAKRVTVTIHDITAPTLTLVAKSIYGDAVYTPQTDAARDSAKGWWHFTNTAVEPYSGPSYPFNGFLEATDACSAVTITSGGFGAIATTGSGYVPGTYNVSFTASDQAGLTTKQATTLTISLATQFTASHNLHQFVAGEPVPFPTGYAPFSNYGPDWLTAKSTSPMFDIQETPDMYQGVEINLGDFQNNVGLLVDSNGHVWYPIPSASWWDPAADLNAASVAAVKMTGGIDLLTDYSSLSNFVHEDRRMHGITNYDWTAVTGWNNPPDNHFLIGVNMNGTPVSMGTHTQKVRGVFRRITNKVAWYVDLRGSTYVLSCSYRISGGSHETA